MRTVEQSPKQVSLRYLPSQRNSARCTYPFCGQPCNGPRCTIHAHRGGGLRRG